MIALAWSEDEEDDDDEEDRINDRQITYIATIVWTAVGLVVAITGLMAVTMMTRVDSPPKPVVAVAFPSTTQSSSTSIAPPPLPAPLPTVTVTQSSPPPPPSLVPSPTTDQRRQRGELRVSRP